MYTFDFIKTEMLFKHEQLFWPNVVNNQFEIEELDYPNNVFPVVEGEKVTAPGRENYSDIIRSWAGICAEVFQNSSQ